MIRYPIEKFYGVYSADDKLVGDLYRSVDDAAYECVRLRGVNYENYFASEVYAIVVSDREAVVIARAGDKRSVR